MALTEIELAEIAAELEIQRQKIEQLCIAAGGVVEKAASTVAANWQGASGDTMFAALQSLQSELHSIGSGSPFSGGINGSAGGR